MSASRRRLGDSDLEISEISLGSWLTYSGGVELDSWSVLGRTETAADLADARQAAAQLKSDRWWWD